MKLVVGLLSCLVVFVATEAQTTDDIDHGKALMDWLKKTEGGFFHPNLELRRQEGDVV